MWKQIILSLYIVGIASNAFAWSWTDDAEGEKLDTEARHILTTQNVCGAVIKDKYLSELYRKIDRHFTGEMNVTYRRYLQSSVLSANSDYLSSASSQEVRSACRARTLDARQRGVLAQ